MLVVPVEFCGFKPERVFWALSDFGLGSLKATCICQVLHTVLCNKRYASSCLTGILHQPRDENVLTVQSGCESSQSRQHLFHQASQSTGDCKRTMIGSVKI